MATPTYLEIIRQIENRGIMPEGPPTLEPMTRGLERLLPHLKIDPLKTIVVAGTNGKGSVCATLEALFLAAGETTGLYTSPHLEETTERIRINGSDISQELFCHAYQVVETKTKDLRLTHFEILTLIAAWVFYSGEMIPPPKWCIFEVGLGGTWDATNAIPHQNCVVTSLGFDHENLLGNTLPEIAANKFGIVTPKAIVVHAPLPPEVQPLAAKIQSATQSEWIECVPYQMKVCSKRTLPEFLFQTKWGEAPLALPGLRGAQNSAIAFTLFHRLGFHPKSYLSALKQVKWPGRMEFISIPSSPCPVYLSGDHNPSGVQSLLELLPHYPRKHLYVLVGIGKDKNWNDILLKLFSIPDSSIFLTETPFRGCSIQQYGKWLDHAQSVSPDSLESFKKITEIATAEDMILVTGSLYLVGLLRRELTSTKFSVT